MEPVSLTYEIVQRYTQDHHSVVNERLLKIVDGYRRSRSIAKLATCSDHFDWHKDSVDDWRFLRQVEAFVKKNATFGDKEACRLAAESKFFENEDECRETNFRLREYVMGKRYIEDNVLATQISQMTRWINRVLGDFHDFISALPSLVKVTPGATANASRRNSLPQLKMKMRLFCTERAAPYLESLYQYYGFAKPRLVFTRSNRIELVPKNWKTDRTIACEPEGNLPLQLAFDTYAKRRLRRFGIDLRRQESNKERAMQASVSGDFATVDFSSASDTISYNTVSWLLPVDWYCYLRDVRSPDYRGAFGEGTYSKFSSMGNGSTFAIETLLFAGACHAVGSRNFLVYGDDVIIEKEYYEAFVRLTRFLGFSVNSDKSFSEGPFRESCGMDAFDGVDVTPVYIRDIDRRKACLCHLVNTLRSIAFPDGKLEELLLELIAEQALPVVPYQESTLAGVWIDPVKARRLGALRRKGGIDRFKAYVPKTRRRQFVDSRGYYLWFLYKNQQAFFGGPWELSRDSVRFDPTRTSSVPLFEHVYVRKWVVWQEPREGTPDHVVTWSENL